MEKEKEIVENVSKEIKKNMIRDRAKKLDEIDDEKWNLVNKENKDMVEEFLSANKHLSPRTLTQYVTCLRQFFWYVYEKLKDKEFYKISKRDFIKYLGYMQDRHLSSSAIGLRKSAVSSFCNYIENIVAEDMEECEKFRNFTRGMPSLAKTKCYEKIAITKDEHELIMKTLEDRKDYLGMAWVATAYNVGARRAELIQFRTEILEQEFNYEDGYILTHNLRGKGKSIEGKIIKYMINEDAYKYMKLWIKNRGYESEYIFTTKYGGKIKPLSVTWANDFCVNVVSKIVGRRINPHLYKSTVVTRLLSEGVDMKLVSEFIAHHESVETTSIYDLRNFEEEKKNIFKKKT